MIQPRDGEQLQSAWRALAEDGSAGHKSVSVDAPQSRESSQDDAIWRAVTGEGSAEERARIVDLVAIDPAAAESWRVAQELHRELESHESPLEDRWSPRRYSWVAMAAAVLMAIGLGWWQLGPVPFEDGPDVYRQAQTADLHSLVSEDEAQPRDRMVLSWSNVGPDARYSVRVLGPDLEPLIELEELTSTSVQLSAEPLASVADGERLLWQVEARRSDGQIITSPTYFLDVAPATPGSTPTNDPSPDGTDTQEP